jgi:hypothetical protein
MKTTPILTALSSRSIAASVRQAKRRVVYAAPGIQSEPARALAGLASAIPLSAITISLDFDEHTLRMGYGDLQAVEILAAAGITPTHSPGLRSGILIVDDRGWVFTPTALYLGGGTTERRNAECSGACLCPSGGTRRPPFPGCAEGSH